MESMIDQGVEKNDDPGHRHFKDIKELPPQRMGEGHRAGKIIVLFILLLMGKAKLFILLLLIKLHILMLEILIEILLLFRALLEYIPFLNHGFRFRRL